MGTDSDDDEDPLNPPEEVPSPIVQEHGLEEEGFDMFDLLMIRARQMNQEASFEDLLMLKPSR